MYSLWQYLSHGTISFDLVTLTLNFDLLLKNFNLGCYLVMVAARRASLSSDNSYWHLGTSIMMFMVPNHCCNPTVYNWFKWYSTSLSTYIRYGNLIIPPATKLGGYTGITMSVCPSVCRPHLGFRRITAFPFTSIIMKLHMQTPHESRMCPIDFEVQRSRSQCINYWKWFPAHNCFPLYTYHHEVSHADSPWVKDVPYRFWGPKVKVTMHKLLKMVSGA